LPIILTYLKCSSNIIQKLNNLPFSLKYLKCSSNHIQELNNLPNTLTYFYCSRNNIRELDNLSPLLKILHCDVNLHYELNNIRLPSEWSYYNFQKLNTLPLTLNNLPILLYELYCDNYYILKPPIYITTGSLDQKDILNKINKAHQIQCPYRFNKHYSKVIWSNKCKKNIKLIINQYKN
jgi:hypothetical protein